MKKMILKILVFWGVMLIAGCASLMGLLDQRDPLFSVERIHTAMMEYTPGLSFEGIDFINTRLQKKAERELTEFTPLAGLSGIITIKVRGVTLESAQGINWTFIVMDNEGVDIKREKGENDIPSASVSQYGTVWSSYQSVAVPQGVSFPLTVRIVSAFGEDYTEYLISRTG